MLDPSTKTDTFFRAKSYTGKRLENEDIKFFLERCKEYDIAFSANFKDILVVDPTDGKPKPIGKNYLRCLLRRDYLERSGRPARGKELSFLVDGFFRWMLTATARIKESGKADQFFREETYDSRERMT